MWGSNSFFSVCKLEADILIFVTPLTLHRTHLLRKCLLHDEFLCVLHAVQLEPQEHAGLRISPLRFTCQEKLCRTKRTPSRVRSQKPPCAISKPNRQHCVCGGGGRVKQTTAAAENTCEPFVSGCQHVIPLSLIKCRYSVKRVESNKCRPVGQYNQLIPFSLLFRLTFSCVL